MFAFCLGFIAATIVGIAVPQVPAWMLVAGDWARNQRDRIEAWWRAR